jgi:tetratricopeptide (TPR) repeat protein
LERDGQYEGAEKLYKQALLIKQKNLGPENPESIAQNSDLARVSAARGRKSQACKYYEDGLKALRKLPNPGRAYATMLESYGDMLDRMNDKTRAEKIYEEARIYHEKLSAAKN